MKILKLIVPFVALLCASLFANAAKLPNRGVPYSLEYMKKHALANYLVSGIEIHSTSAIPGHGDFDWSVTMGGANGNLYFDTYYSFGFSGGWYNFNSGAYDYVWTGDQYGTQTGTGDITIANIGGDGGNFDALISFTDANGQPQYESYSTFNTGIHDIVFHNVYYDNHDVVIILDRNEF